MAIMIYPKPVRIVLRKGIFGNGIYDYQFLIRFNGQEFELGSNAREMGRTIRERYDTQAKAIFRTFQYYPELEFIGKPDFTKTIN